MQPVGLLPIDEEYDVDQDVPAVGRFIPVTLITELLIPDLAIFILFLCV